MWPRETKKKDFEVSVSEKKGVKSIEGRFRGEPFYLAIERTEKQTKGVDAKVAIGPEVSGEGHYKKNGTDKWDVFVNPKSIPDFVPIDRMHDFIRTGISISGGTVTPLVNTGSVTFKEPDREDVDAFFKRQRKMMGWDK